MSVAVHGDNKSMNVLVKDDDDEVAPFRTLLHGDYKAMNVFVPVSGNASVAAIPIDFQWTGPGIGMLDVAMHLYHSVEVTGVAGDGDYSGERALLEFYYQRLLAAIAEFHGGAEARSRFS